MHDIPHTAFSHLTDRIFSKKGESYHESIFSAYLSSRPDLKRIFAKHKVDISKFLDLSKFPFLSAEKPNLSIDRLDYVFREMALNGEGELANNLSRKLIVLEKHLAFADIESARIFAKRFVRFNNSNWFNKDKSQRAKVLARLLTYALQKRIIVKSDFFKLSEIEILRKLEASGDLLILTQLNQLREKKRPTERKDVFKTTQSRALDPAVHTPDLLWNWERLTSLDKKYKLAIERLLAKNKPPKNKSRRK